MKCTIDASVFVAIARADEAQHADSVDFLRQLRRQGVPVFCPSLVLPECAGAISRPTGGSEDARRLVRSLERFNGMGFVSLDMPRAERAAEIAITCRLRGSDSTYVAVAEVFDSVLVTWDAEMLARGPAVVPTMTPTDWLARYTPSP